MPDGKPAIEVEVQNHSACPRYSGIVIRNIQVGPSPEHIQERLKAIGGRAVNNVVDVTNLVLHELGQPLHAFDLDKIGGQRIVVRNVADGTTFHGLDDKEYTLSAQDLMICDAEGAMCIGGVFGGKGQRYPHPLPVSFWKVFFQWRRNSSFRIKAWTENRCTVQIR